MIIPYKYLSNKRFNNNIDWVHFEYFNDFLDFQDKEISNIKDKTIIIWSYYNIIENFKFIKNISVILEKIKSTNIKYIQIQIPFLKQSLIDTLNEKMDLPLKKIIDFINNSNIKIEFVINNYLDLYVIDNLIKKWLNKKNVLYSIWPQFFFINYDPINLLTDRQEEIKQFIRNISVIIKELKNKYNVNIGNIYFFEAHIAYFYWLEHYINKWKQQIQKYKEMFKNYNFNIKIVYWKNILSITDRIYQYFEYFNQTKHVSTRISNKEIYLWLFDNINDINNIKGNYNYSIFKWLDKNNLLKHINAFYENNYEYFELS